MAWLEQQRAGRDQEADRVLDGVDVVDEALGGDEVEHRAVVVERRPRRERDPRRPQDHARRAGDPERLEDVHARVALVEVASTVSLSDSTAETMKAQPSATSSGSSPRLARRCSILAVASKVSCGNSAWSARATAIAWPGPLRKSGSPNVMCGAPAATSCRTSARTTSSGTTKNLPPYTGGMGQCRQSACSPGSLRRSPPAPAGRPVPASRISRATAALRRGTGNASRARCGAARRGRLIAAEPLGQLDEGAPAPRPLPSRRR